ISHGEGGALLAGPVSVFVEGNYAYVASLTSDALEIVDISNPKAPIHAGKIRHTEGGAFLSSPQSVFIKDNFAYVTGFSNALEVIDITDPTQPRHVGVFNEVSTASINRPQTVYVTGDYAYIADGFNNSLEIVDISDPKYPIKVGEIIHGQGGAVMDTPWSVFVSEDHAFIPASGYNISSLEVINISNPKTPMHASSITHGEGGGASLDGTQTVILSGKNAFVLSQNSDALEIVDISKSIAPRSKGRIAHCSGEVLLDDPRDMVISGKYAYVVSYNSDALQILDISNPEKPAHVGRIIHGEGGAFLNAPQSIFIEGNYAYVASKSTLEIIDISNPKKPVHAASVVNEQGGALLDDPRSVVVSGDYAFVVSFFSNALEIIDVSNPKAPFHVSSLKDGTGGALLRGPVDVLVSEGYAYVVSSGSDALEVIDVRKPESPKHVGNITHGKEGVLMDNPRSVFIEKNFAYVASLNSDAITMIDIRKPQSPVLVTNITKKLDGALLMDPHSVYVSGNYMYVASYHSDAMEIISLYMPVIPKANPASDISEVSFTASCKKISNATLGYYLDVSTDDFETFLPGYENHLGSNTVKIEGLLPGVTYRYRFRTANPNGISENSNVVSVITKASIPVAHSATKVNSNGFTANWNQVRGSFNYFLEVSTEKDFSTTLEEFDGKTAHPTNTNYVSITGLEAGIPYYYRVTARNSSGKSGPSNTMTVLTAPRATITKEATDINQTGFTAQWESVEGEVFYLLDVSRDEKFSDYLVRDIKVADSVYHLSSLTPGLTYYYRVRTGNKGGFSANSNTSMALLIPGVPGVLAVNNFKPKNFEVQWKKVEGATEYMIDVSTDNFTTFLPGYKEKAIQTNQVVIEGLKIGKVYKIRVKAKNSSGQSEYSEPFVQIMPLKSMCNCRWDIMKPFSMMIHGGNILGVFLLE
ncbi:MAG: hypothetical protein OEY34_01740, partial [Cyclobacteriaceae bacterium]|nr:hypothetical protein [Cyclobacteriaceae bacterium]